MTTHTPDARAWTGEREDFLGDIARSALEYLADQARRAHSYATTQKYGCFCGSGRACAAPIDDLDDCCQKHDRGYDWAGVNTPGGVDMWTPLGFRLGRPADLALVSCARATLYDLHWYGPAAAAYREGMIALFTLRADIAQRLEAMPACIKDNRSAPVWEVARLFAACP